MIQGEQAYIIQTLNKTAPKDSSLFLFFFLLSQLCHSPPTKKRKGTKQK